MMPIVEVALDHKRKGRTERRTLRTWAPDAGPSNRSTSTAAAAAGCWIAG